MSFDELFYLSLPFIAAFDGDDPPADDPPADDPPAGKSFTQDEVNKFLADDRRKHQTKLKQVETRLQETLKNKGLSEEERANLEESLEDMRKQIRTKDEQATHEKKKLETKYTKELEEQKEAAKTWESRYRNSMIERSLQDAAVSGDAFSASQIVALLKPTSKLIEDEGGKFKPVVDIDTTNDAGESVVLQLSPAEAVEHMKNDLARFGNLFKSNVVPGIGSNSATGGLAPGKDGRIDLKKLAEDPVAYREARKKGLQV